MSTGGNEIARLSSGYSLAAVEAGALYLPGQLVQVRVQRELTDKAMAFEATAGVAKADGPLGWPIGVRVSLIDEPLMVQGEWPEHCTPELRPELLTEVGQLMELAVFDRLTGRALRAPKTWQWIRIMAIREQKRED